MSNAPRQRLSARDYKHGSREGRGFDLAQYKQFGIGLGVGLAVALLVWLQSQRAKPTDPVPQVAAPAPEVAPVEEADPAERLEFYDMAANFEVEVPAEDRGRRNAQPSAPVTTPGAYELQAESFRDRTGAERQRERLAKLGIEATIQHVTVDEKEWYRVIVGPMRDLAKLNEIRETLRVAQVTFRIRPVAE